MAEDDAGAYLDQRTDNSEDGQSNCDHQLDEDEGLDVYFLLWKNHLHIRHGNVTERLDNNVALRHALQHIHLV